MAPSGLPHYAALPSASTAALPNASSTLQSDEQPTSEDLELDVRVYGPEDLAEETDYDAADGRKGLLSGREKRADEEDPEESAAEGQTQSTKRRRLRIPLRTLFFSGLFVAVLLLLAALFHPSSPYSSYGSSLLSSSTDVYYGGTDLAAGVYDPSHAAVAPNPLPTDATFGDIPFAKVGESKDKSGRVPNWAGGDWGDAEAEKELVAGKGKRWNGTHWFDPTVIIISLDGVRTDYLEEGLTPHLLDISRRGIRAEYMRPSFPTLTFPNHWSLLTGLYPSAHGIVANDFFDPAVDKEFVYTEPSKSWDSDWWSGEPLWATAAKNSLRSAVLMWPGPPVLKDGTSPTLWYPFVNHFNYHKKVNRVEKWLDMPYSKRPHLMAVYAPEVDQAGHRSGPHSHPVDKTLREMDSFVKGISELIDKRNLTEIVDVIVVSDHGMAATSDDRLIFLDDILGEDGFKAITHNEGWPSAGLRFAAGTDESEMLHRLQTAAAKPNSGFSCYTSETMPERWHFTGHERIAPIYCVPEVGWAITNHEELEVTMRGTYKIKGNHGYDNSDPSMHAIFVAHGPFADAVKNQQQQRSALARRQADDATPSLASDPHTHVIPGFDNVELYDLVASLLRIPEEKRALNNGTGGFWEQYIDFATLE
ncbi:hypothetical protein JCM10908_001113 [Rhodotorula pacifica]|uniref:alkaline phosphatase family protein n=1 Tax=Rhodotorula pacifica TaxID=1495444 RepID=UPI00317A04E5